MTRALATCAAVVAFLLFAAAYEVSVWRECLGDHSWFYCLRVLGR